LIRAYYLTGIARSPTQHAQQAVRTTAILSAASQQLPWHSDGRFLQSPAFVFRAWRGV